jgi:mannose-6-phosphate isomerase-like protein (cupin superfamily)
LCGDKPIKSGDILHIKAGQKINIQNNASKNLKVVTVYIPSYNEDNIGYES